MTVEREFARTSALSVGKLPGTTVVRKGRSEMRRIAVLVMALLLALACSAALAEEKRWVSSDGTTLKKEASVSSEDVAPLAVGAELAVVEASGRWLKVRTADGRVGWVYAGRVVDAPPAAEV